MLKKTRSAFRLFLYICTTGLLFFSVFPVFSGGRREAKEAAEVPSREVEFYILSTEPPGAGPVRSPRPETEAAYFLFQQFKSGGGAVQIVSNRQLSAPIGEKEEIELGGGLWATRYTAEVEPAQLLSYIPGNKVKVSFGAEELSSGDRVMRQPAQTAIVTAVREEKAGEGLARVESISMDSRGRFDAVVEFAEPLR